MRLPIFALILPLVLGCDDRAARKAAGPDQDGIASVSANDKEMNAAIAEARARLPEFLAALRDKNAARSHFSVKADIARVGEHIWIGDVTLDSDEFKGRLENVPRDTRNLKYGDAVTVEASAISDWLYVDDGRLVGAFTLRVIYTRMTPQQREAFRRQVPYKTDW